MDGRTGDQMNRSEQDSKTGIGTSYESFAVYQNPDDDGNTISFENTSPSTIMKENH